MGDQATSSSSRNDAATGLGTMFATTNRNTAATSRIAESRCAILVQYRPCWTLHALLRFKGIQYITRNIEHQSTLGKPAPVFIDGSYAASEAAAIEHIHTVQPYQEELTAEDVMIWTYVENNLNTGLRYLRQLVTQKDTEQGVLSYVYAMVFDTKPSETIRDFDNSMYANMKKDDVLNNLDKFYQYLQSMLSETNSLLLWSNTLRSAKTTPTLADAALFGHIAEALCNADVKDRLYGCEMLMKFFRDMSRTFFPLTGQNDIIIFENSFMKAPEALPLILVMKEAAATGFTNNSESLSSLDIFHYGNFLHSMQTHWANVDFDFPLNRIAYFSSRGGQAEEVDVKIDTPISTKGALFIVFVVSGFVVYSSAALYGAVVILSRRKTR
jgi:hypothetical protein